MVSLWARCIVLYSDKETTKILKIRLKIPNNSKNFLNKHGKFLKTSKNFSTSS